MILAIDMTLDERWMVRYNEVMEFGISAMNGRGRRASAIKMEYYVGANTTMTQEDRWIKRYKEVMEFMEKNYRNPSKCVDAERGLRNWVK